jgi:NAD(P)-dependent dehydrogenase (short-subunit alcohol dehydrogenase family)
MGRIDVAVSNAGYGLFGAAEELTDAQIDHQIAVI